MGPRMIGGRTPRLKRATAPAAVGLRSPLVSSVSGPIANSRQWFASAATRSPDTGGGEAKQKYMVCLDGSDNSFRALQAAKQLLKSNDELILATVPPQFQSFTGYTETVTFAPEMMTNWVASRDASVKKILEQAKQATGDLQQVQVRSAVGQPSTNAQDELLQIAAKENVDYIVVGSRGKRPLTRMMLGSVSSYLTTHADCNVIVVPPHAPLSQGNKSAKTGDIMGMWEAN